MSMQWIVVADKVSARIFKRLSPKGQLELLTTLENPEGKLKEQELASDRPGRSFSTGGVFHSAFSAQQSQREHIVEGFMRMVSDYLEQHALKGEYQSLILVAEPKALGRLREMLGPNASNKVVGSMPKDLVHADLGELKTQIEGSV
jgi:protein required for attachment to host cells